MKEVTLHLDGKVVRRCTTCREMFPADNTNFYNNKRGKGGLSNYCKKCAHAYGRKRYHAEKERTDNTDKRYKQVKVSISWTNERKKRWYLENREEMLKRSYKRRLDVLSHYSNGTVECACCGEKTYEFLAIDHINGSGLKHRKANEIKSLHTWLRLNNYPSGFQVLCHNCNQAKACHGVCPHKTGVSITDRFTAVA